MQEERGIGGQALIAMVGVQSNQYPRSVWDALVAQGKLKKGSQGQYELA